MSYFRTKELREKLSKMFRKGKDIICPNCGKSFYVKPSQLKRRKFCSKKCLIEYVNKTNIWKGKSSHRKGKRFVEYQLFICKNCERKFEIRKSRIKWGQGIYCSNKCKLKFLRKQRNYYGKNNPNYGNGNKIKGEKNPNWRGGKSFEIYPQEFNKTLKEMIRKRDNYTCQECGYSEKQLGYKLHIHHINFDKENNHPNNLISLCNSCHTKTNFKREDWIRHFKEKVLTQA